jgi:Thioredoxin
VPDSAWSATGVEVLSSKDFTEGRLNRPGTYVVCFGAAWCGPTRRFMPNFVQRKNKWPGTTAIADITDRNDPLWDIFQIRITPSIIVFREGRIRLRADGRRFVGITTLALDKLEQALAESSS